MGDNVFVGFGIRFVGVVVSFNFFSFLFNFLVGDFGDKGVISGVLLFGFGNFIVCV